MINITENGLKALNEYFKNGQLKPLRIYMLAS